MPAAVDSEYFPAGQDLQADDPSLLYIPATQDSQLEDITEAANFPAEQDLHTDERARYACFPAAQDVQVVEPTKAANLPASHWAHWNSPTASAYRPVLQLMQALIFFPEYLPGVQLEHEIAAALFEYIPPKQDKQRRASKGE